MKNQEQAPLPPPSHALSALKILVLVWFLMMAAGQRARAVRTLSLIAEIFQGPVKDWPIHLDRPFEESEETIEATRGAANWLARLAQQLRAVMDHMPSPPPDQQA